MAVAAEDVSEEFSYKEEFSRKDAKARRKKLNHEEHEVKSKGEARR